MKADELGPRNVERLLATLLLLGSAPFLVVAMLAIYAGDGRPVLFRQWRAGYRGSPFEIFKLRTMRKDVPPPEDIGQVLETSPLVLPRIGTVLRRTKLDEVPQLLNVVRGEMRFVGPRPALVSDLDAYSTVEWKRLEVPPGLTGWAQVNGNARLDWSDRIALDLWYVAHRSLRLDWKIVGMTIWTVFIGEHVNEQNVEEARRHAARLTGRG